MSNNRHTSNGHLETPVAPVTLRQAAPADSDALERLAELDSARTPEAPVLVAEVAGQLRAAISLVDGHAVADPFHPTEAVLAMLRARSGSGFLAAAGSPLGAFGRALGRRSGTRDPRPPQPSAPSVPGIPTLPSRV